MNNRNISQITTLVFLALWHGWHPGIMSGVYIFLKNYCPYFLKIIHSLKLGILLFFFSWFWAKKKNFLNLLDFLTGVYNFKNSWHNEEFISDWLIDLSIDWLIDWLIDLSIDWLLLMITLWLWRILSNLLQRVYINGIWGWVGQNVGKEQKGNNFRFCSTKLDFATQNLILLHKTWKLEK